MNAMIAFFKKIKLFFTQPPLEKWLLVRTYTVSITVTRAFDPSRIGEQGFAYTYMFESETGKRRVEFGCSLGGFDAETTFKKLNEWATEVYPWLNGRYLTGTPSYSEAERIDVVEKLKDHS